MKLTSVKGKIVAGAVSVSLLTGMGTAFANTDAGTQLQNWYSSKFNISKNAVAQAQANYAAGQQNALINEANTLKNTTVGNVAQAGTSEIDRANGAITSAKNQHIEAIQNQQATIEEAAPGQYDTYVSKQTNWLNGVVDSAATAKQTEMEGAVNAEGTTQVTAVNAQVGATKQDAINALKQEIEDAKADLEQLIADEQEAATIELKANFDTKITDVRAALTAKMTELETLKKQEIEKVGQDIEEDAQEELAALVSGITE